MKFKDVIKVGVGFLAGGLYVCWVEADACRRGSWYIQHRYKDGHIAEIGKPIFDPSTAEEEEAPE